MDEKKALRALQRRDTGALCWFIDRYTAYVCTIISRIIGNSMSASDVEEAASDVFLAFWNNADKVDPDCIKGYLGSIARNAAKKKLRRQNSDLPLDEDIILVTGSTPEDAYVKKERERLVRQAVLSMDAPDREIFLRFYFYYQPIAQIAEEMSLTEAAVKTRLHRGRERLRKEFQGDILEGDEPNGIENNRPYGLHSG